MSKLRFLAWPIFFLKIDWHMLSFALALSSKDWTFLWSLGLFLSFKTCFFLLEMKRGFSRYIKHYSMIKNNEFIVSTSKITKNGRQFLKNARRWPTSDGHIFFPNQYFFKRFSVLYSAWKDASFDVCHNIIWWKTKFGCLLLMTYSQSL